MKIKHILIVSIILAIFTIGAVSASEDLNISDDTLAVEDGIDDSIAAIDDSDSEVDDETLAEIDDSNSDDDDSLGEIDQDIVSYDRSKVTVTINSGTTLDKPIISFLSEDATATGTLTVDVNDQRRYNKTIAFTDYNGGKYNFTITPYEIGIRGQGDSFNIKVSLDGVVLTQQANVVINPYTFYFTDEWGYDLDDGYYGYGDTINLYVYVPKDAPGKVRVTVNGKTYSANHRNGLAKIAVETKGWNLGMYQVKGEYVANNDNEKYLSRTIFDQFLIRPDVSAPDIMSLYENAEITISASPTLSGQATIIVEKRDVANDIWLELRQPTVSVKAGKATYSLSNLEEGEYRFTVSYQIGTYQAIRVLSTFVLKNTAGISSSITPDSITEGELVWVKLTGPRLDETDAYIYVDNEFVKGVILKTGKLNEAIFDLSPGTHKINVYLYNSQEEDGLAYFHSNTQFVTVKEKPQPVPKPVYTISLKKVAVSKSAKKLVLSATVKADGVVKSGQTVKFTFNGKTYSAKTNAKGVASVTIKSTVLKKLKVGKTITYKAVSHSKTATQKVKVKK